MAKIRIISTPNSFKEGGGIHIDPENKGKFNETKRRTGKTTEELTHSSNPLTRKRAIFALNAAKWKHDEGGNLFGTGGKKDDPPFWSWENWDNMAAEAEPWASGLSLGGDAAAAALGASGIGAEAAPFVYLGSHIPSAAIDLYLTGRSIANSDLGETLYNATEFGLGAAGISSPKALYNLGKWWRSAFRPLGTHKGKVLFTARDFMKHTDPAYFEPAEEVREVLGNVFNAGFNINDIINASNNSDSSLEELLEESYPQDLLPLVTPEKDRFNWLNKDDNEARESAALLEDNILQWKRERANTIKVDPVTGTVLHRYDSNGNEYVLGGNLFADAGEVDKSNSYQLPFLGNSTWGGFPLRNAFSTNTQGKSPLTSNSYLAIDTTGHAYYKEPNTDFWLPTMLTAKYYNLPISNGTYSGPTIKELPVGTLLVLPGDKYYTEGSGDSELVFPENAYDWNSYKAREIYENGEIVPAALTIGLGIHLPGLTDYSLAELYHSDDYKTIGRQEQVDANLELAGNAVERIFAPLMPTNYYRTARSIISPETDWNAPVVPGNPWMDTVLDLAAPIAAPKIAEGVGTVLKEGVGLAEDVAKYANARMGYYGDNILSRAYGTAARRWELPHTAYPPEYQRVLADNLRYGRLENLVFDENGNLLLGNPNPRVSHEGMVNMTTDQPVVGHSKGNWDNGSVIVVDPKAVDSSRLVSVEPSDTYGIFNDGMPIPARSATVYTGNPRIIQQAEEAGMPYVTSPELLDLYGQILELGKTGTGLEKSVEYSATDAAEEYRKAIQGLLNKRGRPTVEDYRLLENETGLMSGVTPMEDQQLTILNQLGSIDPKAALDDPSLITAQYPNGRLVEVWSNKEMGPLGNASYRNVFYDPATTTEFDFRMFREQGLENGYTDELIMNEWRRLNQENPFDYRQTNWLDWANRGNIRFEIGSSEKSPYSLKSNDISFMLKLLEGSYRRKMAGLPELFPGEYRSIGNFDGTTFTTLLQSRDIMNLNISRLAEMRPNMSLEDIEKIVRDLYNTPYKVYSREDFTKAGFDPKVQGVHFDNGNIAMVNEEIAERTPKRIGIETHEHRHGLLDSLPRTEEENNILTDAYGDLLLAFKESQEEVLRNYDRAEAEWETLNSDARIALLGENRSAKWTALLQNLLIDKMPDEKIIKAVKDADGYGKALVEYYERNGGVPKEKIQAWRKAMKKVGVVAIPIAVTAGLSLPSTSEKQ